ncbi:hypothetical protein SNE40_015520 [Patella caerulea]|uniref:Cadherin-like and PC-esterase domain-containing protein 1 n=1 Tax=Patella caerulea TaxID=87958 RepID=A0AAN8JI56_PATCE
MISVHMSQYLPWLHNNPDVSFNVNTRLNIYRNLKHRDYHEDLLKKLSASSVGLTKGLMDIVNRLAQTEEKSLPNLEQPFILLAEGSLSTVRHEIPLIESVFNRYGVDVRFHVTDGIGNFAQHRKLREVEGLYDGIGWSVLMCLNNTSPTEPCYNTADKIFLKQHQRVNVIPELQEILGNPRSFCDIPPQDTTGKQVETEELDCAVYPDQKQKLSLRCRNQSLWLLKKTPSIIQPDIVDCKNLQDDSFRKSFMETKGVAVKLPDNLYELGDEPMVAMFNVLVMSFSPLRVYLHPQAVAWEGFTSYINKKPQRTLTISELQSLISDTRGSDRSETAINQLEEKIVSTLIKLEALHWSTNNRIRCPTCFQLLDVVTVFNTTFYPTILQIKSSSHHGKQASLNEYLVRQKILEDLASMLVSKDTVTMDVARGLEELGITDILENQQICNKDRSLCLHEDDVQYALKNRQEHLNMRNFRKLYPLRSSVKYTCLLENIYRNKTSGRIENGQHTTSSLHSYLLSLERFYANFDNDDTVETYDDMNIPIDSKQPIKGGIKIMNKLEPRKTVNSNKVLENFTRPNCDKDPSSMPYLGYLSTVPPIKLTPEFSPLVTDYEAVVDYDVMLLTVMAFAKSCSSQARLEDKQGDSGISNITLGIGENKVWIFIVDTSHSDTWVVNTYTILITRQDPDIQSSFSSSKPHQICSLKQDCSLSFSMWDACGLQPVSSHGNWKSFTNHLASTLPSCSSGNSPGEWYVPCNLCRDSNSCYWKQAIWQPKTCQHKRISRENLKDCLAGKKVLFIGDSTNRGILHYMTEQVNGSLLEWDKTHNLKVYSNLNDNRTMFSFAYYPQFWLPAEHRPVFDKALYQLMKRSMPLQNNSNTVLVMGGVHWLGKHHINVVRKALNREGLTGIRLVLKGLGAGFHQPVSGVHCLSQPDHEKLLNHNRVLLDYATKNGYHVVDTFNMTMARYKNFLQGKCACHFHRVSMIKNQNSFQSKSSKPSTYQQPAYHVEGEINAVYSELTINEICQPDQLNEEFSR